MRWRGCSGGASRWRRSAARSPTAWRKNSIYWNQIGGRDPRQFPPRDTHARCDGGAAAGARADGGDPPRGRRRPGGRTVSTGIRSEAAIRGNSRPVIRTPDAMAGLQRGREQMAAIRREVADGLAEEQYLLESDRRPRSAAIPAP